MSTPNTKSMFDAIKQSLSKGKESGGNGLYKEIMKFKPGNTYLIRLVPNPNSPKDSIFHYFNHGWDSNNTGKFVTNLCPSTFGESCPIDTYYLKTYRSGTDSEKKAASVLSRKEGWMVNAYVISDPTEKDNEGQVKILRYGKELDKIISSALDGDDAEEFGVEKVFDVAGGSTLRIKCENRTGDRRGTKQQFVTYSSSKFLSPSDIEVDLEKVYAAVHDLKAVNKQTTPAEMQRMLDEHFFNLTTGSSYEEDADPAPTEAPAKKTVRVEVKDSIDEEPSVEEVTEDFKEAANLEAVEETTDESTDEKLKKLLAEF